MDFVLITTERFDDLKKLQAAYKNEIGEDSPSESDFESLRKAIEQKKIYFYGCVCDGKLVACCSVCLTYSTFNYDAAGVFEDFYIQPAYRHREIARKLVAFAYENSKVSSLSVGCADCDLGLYQAIGFQIPLGNMLALVSENDCMKNGD